MFMARLIMLTNEGLIKDIEHMQTESLKEMRKQITEELNIRAAADELPKELTTEKSTSTKRKPREPKGE